MGGARCLGELRFQWRGRSALDESPEVCPGAADAEAVSPAPGVGQVWALPVYCWFTMLCSFLLYSKVTQLHTLSHVQLFVTPWAVAHQAPLSLEFSRQDYWSGLPFPSPGDLPDPRIEPRSPGIVRSGRFFTICPASEAQLHTHIHPFLILFSIMVYPRRLDI